MKRNRESFTVIDSIQHAWTNMLSVFHVLRRGCPVSGSRLRRKDEQRIRPAAREQLQRFEAGERANVQTVHVHAGMVHLGLVEGKSRASAA